MTSQGVSYLENAPRSLSFRWQTNQVRSHPAYTGVVFFSNTSASLCFSHWYPHWSPCGGALRLFLMRVAHHPLSIFALIIKWTSRAAHETRKKDVLFVTILVTVAFKWGPLSCWRWPVKVISWCKTARWGNAPDWRNALRELHWLSCSRCSVIIFLGNRAEFFSSSSCCKVCECAGCGTSTAEERRGGCSLAWLRQPGDRGEVRKSILDSDWPFTFDRQRRIPVLGVYIISERLRLLHCNWVFQIFITDSLIHVCVCACLCDLWVP